MNLPKTPAIADGGHDWKANSYAHLFWLIGRDDDEEKWNCEMFNAEVTQATTMRLVNSGVQARAWTVTIPLLRNTRAVKKGEELVLKWAQPKKPAKAKARPETWLSDVQKEAKKQKIG